MSVRRYGGGIRYAGTLVSAVVFALPWPYNTVSAGDVVIENDVSVSASSGGNTVHGTVEAGTSSVEASVETIVNDVRVEDFHERKESASGSESVVIHHESSIATGTALESSVRLEASASNTRPGAKATPMRPPEAATAFPRTARPTIQPYPLKERTGSGDMQYSVSSFSSSHATTGVSKKTQSARAARARGRERNIFLARIINAIEYVRTLFWR